MTISAAIFEVVQRIFGEDESRAAAAVRCRGTAVSRRGRGKMRLEWGAGHLLELVQPLGRGGGIGGYGVLLKVESGLDEGSRSSVEVVERSLTTSASSNSRPMS